ncbi:DNA repair protein RecN [Amphibacillus jilinensis]|uniref:DNA repair protein RecN n=1 Tax=Amphibacillus jilinensis TaxID=1216008 RepID=UPI0002DCA38C|nr:DNA repair protein RecN [Amphibacillus jilinensis]
MLTELSIKNFAIIEQLTIPFNDGLTVLTGETGAGKSIIIDAIQLLTGSRGSVEFIRHGAKKATLEGLFILEDKKHRAYQLADQYGVELDAEGMIVLHRTISANGKSICRINGSLITLAILREFGQALIDIHTQHETQSLMDHDRHLELLDLYKKDDLNEVASDYKRIYQKLNAIKQKYQHLKENEQEIVQRLDLLHFQSDELKNAELKPNEDHELREERNKLANYEKIYHSVQEAYTALKGEQHGLDWLSLGLSAIESAAAFESELQDSMEQYSNHYYLLEDIAGQLREYLDNFAFDPDRLNTVESRLNELERLLRKYGSSVDEIIEYAAQIEDEIDDLENREQSLQYLVDQVKELSADALAEASHLHDLRQQAAKELMETLQVELADLYLEKAAFKAEISFKEGQGNDPVLNGTHVALGPTGIDQVRFLLSTNPGEPLKPLHKVASGGELSRIMLAMKTIFAKHQGVTSVIFDEVDTGVSGRVAQSIAEKIHAISNGSQVLCITHLPQVAAMADTHILIEKQVINNATSTKIKALTAKQRVEEIGRMMTGSTLTETSTEHARELIDHANVFKRK